MNPSFAASRLDIPSAIQMPQWGIIIIPTATFIGERDEQWLAGLLLVTKFCNKDDHTAIHNVYEAMGSHFLHRLLRTGTGKGSGHDNRDAYLQLSITILAAFRRVPQIAASEDMVTMIPLIVQTMSLEASSLKNAMNICFWSQTANEEGVKTLYKSGGLSVLASHRRMILPDGSLTKQFAVLQNAMKFEALHLLSAILSNGYNSAPVYDALRVMENDVWSTNMRIGIVVILQNRVAPSHKLQALVLAECVISIVGEGWLIGEMNLTDSQDSLSADRCILLVLESSRVEIAVLLDDLAYLKYEASKASSNRENILVKQRNLGVAFSLVEKIIKLISSLGGEK
ncbi:hypothetical protein K7X08_035203 [Anisodus acutangulus]|uniref:Uncharacterized protein n=1 Tax=Anisodus acutangulus TaxID=402998 RepID=A0A9Q1LJP1_9SOLA|nr:hypothetical protein K7X08_035203 [Anisodus acutangulus]